jgi:hypothetical protein
MPMFLIVASSVITNWGANIFQYTFGYQGIGLQANNPIYEISSSFPELAQWFGIIGGLAYLLPLSITGVFAGIYSDKHDRASFLSVSMAL